MSRRRAIHAKIARDARQDNAALMSSGFLPWVTVDLRLHFPPGTPKRTLLQAIGDAAVKACSDVLNDPTTTGDIDGGVASSN